MSSLTTVLQSLDPTSAQPLYLQLQKALREAIQRQVLNAEDALPSERQLASELGVSRITVRKALDGLASEGLLVRRQGAGNFVGGSGARIEQNFARLTSFSEDMRARGLVPGSEWLRRATGSVNPDEAMKLALSPGAVVYRLQRLRFADGEPMALETCTLAGWALPSAEAVGESLYEALDAGGFRPVRAIQRLRAQLLTADQAHKLRTQPGAAALLVERLGLLRDGRAVELSQSVYRGDTYDFVAELSTGS